MDLRWHADSFPKQGELEDAETATWMADLIKQAVHFVLPDNGVLLNDRLRGLRGREVRLPYPLVTLEYFSKRAPDAGASGAAVSIPRHVIIAQELSGAAIANLRQRMQRKAVGYLGWDALPSECGILVLGVQRIEHKGILGRWEPLNGACLLPRAGWDDTEGLPLVPSPLEESQKAFGIAAASAVLFYSPWRRLRRTMDARTLFNTLANISGCEAQVTLGFAEALTCSNVKAETVQRVSDAVNARRAKAGAIPLYETKTLMVDVSGESAGNKRGPVGADRASPRQHLRRGHIRELESGKRIWITPHVVGNKGFVNKNYALRTKKAA